jgi:peptidylprolyl isomerase
MIGTRSRAWFTFFRSAKAYLCFLLLSATLVLAHAAARAEPDSSVLARLGSIEFHAADFANFLRLLDPNLRKQAASDAQLRNKLIGLEMARIAVLNEAKAKNWQQRTDVARQIERARDDVIVNSYLASIAVLPKAFPSETEIQSAYDLSRDSFMMPRQYHLAQIFVASPKGADKKVEESAKKKLNEVAQKLRAPNAKFEDVARASSEHKSSAAKGGDMGWAFQDQIAPEIRKEIIGMPVGEITDPIHSDAGWHIVRLIATKPAQPRPLAEVKETVVTSLRQQKTKDTEQAYVSKLLEKTPVSVDEEGLRKLFEAAQ